MTGWTVSFHGAAGTVTGSKHLLRIGRRSLLLDAGMFQGPKPLRLRNWNLPVFDPRQVDHVLLSHTHIDHVGLLPRLVKLGLRAPVHATPPACELAELMLMDAAKIQEEDAAYSNRKGFTRHRPARPLFDKKDARAALKLRRSQRQRWWLRLGGEENIRARFLNSGHLLGAAFIEVRARIEGRERRLVYSGDIGRFDMPLHLDPRPLPACDALIVESTYGDRVHDKTTLAEQIGEPVARCLAEGGTVLIPAFAVGRSQQVTLVLRRMMAAGRVPEVPIHIDSPMAVDATRLYSRFLNRRNVDPEIFEDGRLRLFPEKVYFHESVQDSKRLNSLPGPRVIIASSGMLTGGRVLHHLARLAPEPGNLIVLSGHQARGTRGRALLEGADRIKLHGGYVPIRARVARAFGLSGHADSEEILKWVGSAPRPPRVVFVVHGDPPASRALAGKLERRFGVVAVIPELDDRVDLEALLSGVAGRPR